jgi:hypothetical protein
MEYDSMETKEITKISNTAISDLIGEINTTLYFRGRINNRGEIGKTVYIISDGGFFGIATHHITEIHYDEITIDIETDYMKMTLWRNINSYHITFYTCWGRRKTPVNPVLKPRKAFRRYRTTNTLTPCSVCGKSFKNLKLHYRLKHPENSYQVSVINKIEGSDEK